MKNFFFKILSLLMGRNINATPTSVILSQLYEVRALPIGRTEFDEWADRIMSAALVPGVTVESQRFVLAGSLLQLDPGEDHGTDAKFVKMLRKAAVAQTGQSMLMEIKDNQKKRWAAEELAAKEAAEQKLAEVTAPNGAGSHEQVLASPAVQGSPS